MHRIITLFFLLSLSPCFSQPNFPDLEEMAQDFVLETKRIEIPGFPGAFNPSIARYQGQLLMCFRIRDPITASTHQIGLVWLDDDFNLISEAQVLQIRDHNPCPPCKEQDPRLIMIGERLYIVYSNYIDQSHQPEYSENPCPPLEIRRVFVAEVHLDGEQFYINRPDRLISFEGEKAARWEKNWTPFEYNGMLLLGYSPAVHRIFRPHSGTHYCSLIAETITDVKWDWGHLRGGTPALLDHGQYLSFFHSSILTKTVHSQGKKIQHYVMGAYTFEASPPFAITQISPEPIVGKNFYKGESYKTWKPLCVVFPGGMIIDENFVWVLYGRQDFEVWVVKLDKKGLYQSLIPVTKQA